MPSAHRLAGQYPAAELFMAQGAFALLRATDFTSLSADGAGDRRAVYAGRVPDPCGHAAAGRVNFIVAAADPRRHRRANAAAA